MRILVTGATGFIGQALCHALMKLGHDVRRVVRTGTVNNKSGLLHASCEAADSASTQSHDLADTIAVGAIGPETEWTGALTGIEAVVHLAARVHVLKEKAEAPLAEYRLVNVAGTERLAQAAASAGVRRLVYVSSVKVNGEQTRELPFRESDVPDPHDAYGLSKLEAEQALLKIAGESGLEVVIVRPPLVYGPGVGGNFLRLMDLINRGWPMPLGSIHNSRSLIYLGNLVDALMVCLMHPRAAGKIFLVSDGEDVSTPELIRCLSWAMERRPPLISIPPTLLRLAGLLTGKSGEIERLLGSLQVDGSRIRRELQWTPPFSMTQGLRETTAWYLRNTR